MSRIGNKLITVPAGVTIEVAAGNEVTVKGPKGSLTRTFSSLMEIHVEDNVVTVKRPNDEKHTKQLHGTTRALLYNMVVGVSEGFTKDLELVGIGFRTALKGSLEVTCPTATTIKVAGSDKQEVGEFAANIRAVRRPEPYKGKGIRYVGEIIRRKEGKTAGKK